MSDGLPILDLLPEDLKYLIKPAMEYGCHHIDDDIFDFLDRATEREMEDLATIAERVLIRGDYARVIAFLDKHPITDSDEAANLYFLFGVLDYADLQFARAEE